VLSRRAKYGLKAALAIARASDGTPLHIADLARDEGIPPKFLEQILLDLKAADVLRSKKGRGGGYTLARPADAISVAELVRVLDGPLAPTSCVSVNFYRRCEECADPPTCGIRLVMKDVRDAIAAILDTVTLAEANRRSAIASTMPRASEPAVANRPLRPGHPRRRPVEARRPK
jgi:Rrf2 family protein